MILLLVFRTTVPYQASNTADELLGDELNDVLRWGKWLRRAETIKRGDGDITGAPYDDKTTPRKRRRAAATIDGCRRDDEGWRNTSLHPLPFVPVVT